ncbi:MAG: ribosome maturation factor RimM [Actinomycetes bacterium]
MDVVVARIGRPHGIRGEVSAEVRTDDPSGRLAPGTTVRTDPATAGPLTIVSGRVHSGRLLLTFEGCDDRSAAERLRGVLLVAEVDPDELPADPEEFYDHQLAGLPVRTVDGEQVGILHEVLHLPGQDVLAVRRPDGSEVLVPFVRAIVPTVDVAAGVVVVDPPPGLLEVVDDSES